VLEQLLLDIVHMSRFTGAPARPHTANNRVHKPNIGYL
jgi:hypothetical protein